MPWGNLAAFEYQLRKTVNKPCEVLLSFHFRPTREF
jgi:hypothetical protein